MKHLKPLTIVERNGIMDKMVVRKLLTFEEADRMIDQIEILEGRNFDIGVIMESVERNYICPRHGDLGEIGYCPRC